MTFDSLDPHPPVQEKPTDIQQPPALNSTSRQLKMILLVGIMIVIAFGIIRISLPSLQKQITNSSNEESGESSNGSDELMVNDSDMKSIPSDDDVIDEKFQTSTYSENQHSILMREDARNRKAQERALQDQRAANWIRLTSSYRLVQQTNQLLSEMKQAEQDWIESLALLQSNVAGKKVAVNQERLYEFHSLMKEEHFTEQQLANWEQTISTCLVPIELSIQTKDRDYVPDQSLLVPVLDASASIKNVIRKMELDQRSLNFLFTQTESETPGELSLQQALIQLQNQIDSKRLKEVAIARKKIEEEYSQQMAELDREKTRLVQEKKVKDKEHENEKLRLEAVKAVAMQKKEREKIIALQRFEQEYLKMKTLLLCFTAKDYTQVSPDQIDAYTNTTRKEAASLSAIRSRGALEDSTEGVIAMYKVGGERYSTNKRPLGGLTAYDYYKREKLSPSEIERLKTVQQFLREYGEIMVEQGLLIK